MGLFDRGWLKGLLARTAADRRAAASSPEDEVTARIARGARLGYEGTGAEITAAVTEISGVEPCLGQNARYSWILGGAMRAFLEGRPAGLEALFFHGPDSRIAVMDEMMRRDVDPQKLLPFFRGLPPGDRRAVAERDLRFLFESTTLEDKARVNVFIAGALSAARLAEALYQRGKVELVS